LRGNFRQLARLLGDFAVLPVPRRAKQLLHLLVAAEISEVQLVQDHRIGELELGGLQARDDEARSIGADLGQLRLDLVQVLDAPP